MRPAEEMQDQMMNMDIVEKYLAEAMIVQGELLKTPLSCGGTLTFGKMYFVKVVE